MALAKRLCQQGEHPLAFARRPEAVREAEALGVTVLSSPQEVASQSHILLLFLYSDQQVQELLLGPEGLCQQLNPGSVLVIHTTGNPETARAAATVAAQKQAQVIDAPVSGGPHDILAGNITLLVGGEESALNQALPTLSLFADPVIHLGPLGAGQQAKLINNLLFGHNLEIAQQAAMLIEGFGLEQAPVLQALKHCSGNSRALEMAAASGLVNSLIERAGHFVDKDRTVALEVAQALGIKLGPLNPTRQLVD